ncbi:MAG: hypothetical protein A2Y57_03125, partial [Candidatus Woykebacteria bacterium RBG_13_40_7b]
MKAKRFKFHKPDLILTILTIILVLFGLLMVYDASGVVALREFGDKYYFIRLQTIWAALGLILFFVGLSLPYKIWEKLSVPILVVALILLLLTLTPLGVTKFGAQRWLDLGFINISIQPAEAAKLAYIFYLASFLSKKIRLLPFLVVTGLIAAIVLYQRDFGTTTIITLIGLSIYFLAGASIWQFLLLVPALILSGLLLILIEPYRLRRFLTFLNPNLDPLGSAYHIRQILIALGSGGILGVGLGKSVQKFEYLPGVVTDSIFAVIGEELGFLGSGLLISAFLLLIWRGIQVAKGAPDKFGKLLAAGITSWLAIQAFINISAMAAL